MHLVTEGMVFIDDKRKETPNGIGVIGTTSEIDEFASQYSNVFVAIGDNEVRLSLLNKINEETPCQMISLISPKAYVSPSAVIMDGCIVEPMAVVHTGCVIGTGCIISAGAVVNHTTMCCDGVHVDCNATVEGYCLVPACTKIGSGEVYRRKESIETEDFLFPRSRG